MLLVPRWTSEVVLIVWPIALLFGVLRSRFDRSAVSQLILESGAALPPDRLQDVLARTLHDPTVRLAYWLPQQRSFVDSRGDPVAVAPTPQGRALTYLEREGQYRGSGARPDVERGAAAGAGRRSAVP